MYQQAAIFQDGAVSRAFTLKGELVAGPAPHPDVVKALTEGGWRFDHLNSWGQEVFTRIS